MPAESLTLLTLDGIPQVDHRILTCAGQHCSVRTERHRIDRPGMSEQCKEEFACGDIEDQNSCILTRSWPEAGCPD